MSNTSRSGLGQCRQHLLLEVDRQRQQFVVECLALVTEEHLRATRIARNGQPPQQLLGHELREQRRDARAFQLRALRQLDGDIAPCAASSAIRRHSRRVMP